MRPIPPARHRGWVLLMCFVFLFAACGGGGGEEAAPAEAAPADQTQNVLACSDACRAQGQCGVGSDGSTNWVLGNASQPETRNHNQIFPVDRPISILDAAERVLQPPEGDPFPQMFSLITINEDGKTGWVANWCISTVPAP